MPMMEYSFPIADGTIFSIAKPAVQANNFEIKPSTIQIIRSSVQFSGLPEEDPNKHLSNFLLDMESLYDAWEHFKGMLRRCPHHELPVWAAVFNIIDEIATNLYSYGLERTDKRVAGIHSVDAITTLSAQMATLTQKVDNIRVVIWNGSPIGLCGACGQMGHLSQDSKIPSYAKFLKEVISNKRKWEGGETVKLNEECSAILQNKLPPKLKDPRSFSIPCTIGNADFDKVRKEEHKEVTNFIDTGHEPNKKKRWRNQAYKNGELYKEHTKARDESRMRKKKFKDGVKRHHKNKGPIKVDWQRIKHYLKGVPPPVEHPLLLSHP
ncbi:UNVERIFIED_CONTAM: hypothetical protein Slati_4177600 [Sesamum latifolium]|uniref:Uncharacterized protein n=1 Tax=Sesamum latifolium TaxID=2727402 RepID=A0AAW2TA65_9LAMI